MKVENKEYKMEQGPSRAQTRDNGNFFSMGNFPGKKLLYQLFSVNEKLKKLFKKISLCKDKRCLTCPSAGIELIEEEKEFFCKTENVVYLLECGWRSMSIMDLVP